MRKQLRKRRPTRSDIRWWPWDHDMDPTSVAARPCAGFWCTLFLLLELGNRASKPRARLSICTIRLLLFTSTNNVVPVFNYGDRTGAIGLHSLPHVVLHVLLLCTLAGRVISMILALSRWAPGEKWFVYCMCMSFKIKVIQHKSQSQVSQRRWVIQLGGEPDHHGIEGGLVSGF